MTGGGRVAALFRRLVPDGTGAPAPPPRRRFKPKLRTGILSGDRWGMARRLGRGLFGRLLQARLPRGVGVAASLAIILGSIAYGAVRGEHVPVFVDEFKGMRDMAANAAGLRIAAVSLSGHKHLTREEVMAAAGVNGRTSLLFLDVADARLKLLTNPWIAEATVQKLYPDRLSITITEREAYALWQKDGRVGIIAADGTVLEPYVSRRFTGLPLFVGEGAAAQAKEFTALIGRYPAVRDALKAAVLVAERRWNLRLKNGVDVRLPETEVEAALDRLSGLIADKKILERDIAAIDLRLPDRVTVRLSDGAAAAREEARAKKDKAKPKGGNA
jgi:cell division protein FtsQ